MKERWKEMTADADDKQESQFNIWLSAGETEFPSGEVEKEYREKVTLMKDAIQLKKTPQRIPVCPSPGFFPIQNAGISMYDGMYDYEALARSWELYCNDFKPDSTSGPGNVVSGRVLDILDFKLYQWPGHGVAAEGEYQYVESDYMRASEYQDLIDDPTGFFLNTYFPRIFGTLQGLERLPMMAGVSEIPGIPPFARPFGSPEVQQALENLKKAGLEAQDYATHLGKINQNIRNQGIPIFSGGFAKAPFDVIGDCMRGTQGVFMDIFRCPDELIEACERMTPFMIKSGVRSCKANGHIMCFIPLHKGADGFMSDKQFQTFYWPTLRKLIIGLVNEGIVPLLFAEGGYNQRLDVIADVPPGKTVWWFDATDMARAKETVGHVACLAGNMPLDLLCTGTPEDVKSHCKKLIETAGRDGGFIFSSGAGLQGSKAENVKTMIDYVKTHGLYD